MADAVMRGSVPAKKQPNIYVEAFKEASVTAVLVFLLSVYMVGIQTQASQGQPLSFMTRFMDVFWACLLVPAGRFLIALDRQGMHAGLQFRIERLHHRTMLCEPGLTGKGRRGDANAEMGFALGARTSVPLMSGRLVNHFKMAWGEFGRKFCK